MLDVPDRDYSPSQQLSDRLFHIARQVRWAKLLYFISMGR